MQEAPCEGDITECSCSSLTRIMCCYKNNQANKYTLNNPQQRYRSQSAAFRLSGEQDAEGQVEAFRLSGELDAGGQVTCRRTLQISNEGQDELTESQLSEVTVTGSRLSQTHDKNTGSMLSHDVETGSRSLENGHSYGETTQSTSRSAQVQEEDGKFKSPKPSDGQQEVCDDTAESGIFSENTSMSDQRDAEDGYFMADSDAEGLDGWTYNSRRNVEIYLQCVDETQAVDDVGSEVNPWKLKGLAHHLVPLDMKRCICHFVKWQIHPFRVHHSADTAGCPTGWILKKMGGGFLFYFCFVVSFHLRFKDG